MWQGRLFALMEGAPPTEIDPRDLSTIGETDLGGVVVSAFSAHPHRVASRGALYNFGLEYGRVTRLHLYELPDAGGAAPPRRRRARGPADAARLHRDRLPPDLLRVAGAGRRAADAARPQHVRQAVPLEARARHRGDLRADRSADRGAAVHDRRVLPVALRERARARQRAGGRLRPLPGLHLVHGHRRGRRRRDPRGPREGRFHRATIDLAARTLRSEQVADRGCEFPTLVAGDEGRAQRITYLALDDLGAVGSIDARGTIVAHELPADERASEPIHVDGSLLVLCHRSERAYVAVYDAARIPDGPVAKLWLDHHVPLTFHGTFARG